MKTASLIKKYQSWEMTNENGLTLDECMAVLDDEQNVDYDVYQGIMDFRDHLEMEGE